MAEKSVYSVYKTPGEMAEAFADDISVLVRQFTREKGRFNVALSGGNTPRLLFKVLAYKYSDPGFWEKVHFYWVDERCVSPDDPESNYGMTRHLFLETIKAPDERVHRMKGEEDPVREAERYAHEIRKDTGDQTGMPLFDLIILGIGDDGHTASIFPDSLKLLDSENLCEVSVHPLTGQKRITLTGKVINNANNIVFLATGSNKAGIIAAINDKKSDFLKYPAAHICPQHGSLKWYLDAEAGAMVSQAHSC